ncbi:FecCD family ABC transporter permease [Streptosporangium algeriense]|uniref:FecCD family ABC transporter permease n=1 Tax=Streptosporangium algeriense TaxID=1682748 RepID=A0ABW3E1T0_9ACTN
MSPKPPGEIAARAALTVTGLVTTLPVLALVNPSMVGTTYGVTDPGPMVLALLQHRGVLQLLLGAALLWAVLSPPVRLAASLAAILAKVAFLGLTGAQAALWLAFLGAAVVTVLVYVVGALGRAGANPARLILVGVALSAVLAGIQSGLTLLDPRALDGMRAWAAGSLAAPDPVATRHVVPFVLAGLALAAWVTPAFNAVAMGEDLSRSLGANLVVVRILTVVAVTLLTGGATALAGPIMFLGLMVAHIARHVAGPDHRRFLPVALLLGPLVLLSADVLARVVVWPGELPVGVVTAFLGAPVLIALIRRRDRGTA